MLRPRSPKGSTAGIVTRLPAAGELSVVAAAELKNDGEQPLYSAVIKAYESLEGVSRDQLQTAALEIQKLVSESKLLEPKEKAVVLQKIFDLLDSVTTSFTGDDDILARESNLHEMITQALFGKSVEEANSIMDGLASEIEPGEEPEVVPGAPTGPSSAALRR